MAKNLKPIVINTRVQQAAGSEFTWNKLQSPEIFISKIVTSEVNVENSEELSKLISGIPTPFARAAMFRYAINYADQPGEATGLLSFYKTLQDEWKGLVACIALDNQPIKVTRINLTYSDQKDAETTRNIYEPKGALGNMLFEDKELWCDPVESLDSTKKAAPFIYVIKYNDTVVGGTSPESFLFTAPVYNLTCNKGFYSSVTKKFTDPLKSNLSREETEKLYAYVKHINQSINGFVSQFTRKRPQVAKISVFLNNWLGEISSYASKKGYELDYNAIVPNLSKFQAPFDKLFNFQTRLYGFRGRISSDLLALDLPEGVSPVEVELSEILLNPDTASVAEIIFDNDNDATQTGVHMLRAVSDRGDRYFTLPLSEKGLSIFQDEIGDLLTRGGDVVKSHLSAIYDIAARTLHVTLEVDVNGNITSFPKSYKEPVKIDGQKIICWPDFISKAWNKYYLYSELPHNAPELKAFPLRGDRNDYRLMAGQQGDSYAFSKIALNGRNLVPVEEAETLVGYDLNKLGQTDLKYEIYVSAHPFKGVEFQSKAKNFGYLVFKNINSGNDHTLKDFRSLKETINPVRVGFDFGSNNTCISFAETGGQPQLITFRNRRKFLLGVDTLNNDKAAALPAELFFFQNEETSGNRIKSMIMLHDERRVSNTEQDLRVSLSKEIKGGFPVFEKNIPVERSEETRHVIQLAAQQNFIKYNMKWSSDEKEKAYKQAFLKTLWLKTYAELFDMEKYPESLVWAYPSSMNAQIVNQYRNLWADVGKVNPLIGYNHATVAQPNIKSSQRATADWGNGTTGDDWSVSGADDWSSGNSVSSKSVTTQIDLQAQTEAESVCRHALGIGLNPGPRGLLLGFDVGGSTTDILCVALHKNSEGRPVNTLIKQSSIKFAAGKLADATSRSRKFQDVLTTFCRKKYFYIHGVTVPPIKLNESTSSFYYNMIVDRLTDQQDLSEFYRNISADCPELFVLNAYMTGLILFYAGQLSNKIRTTSRNNPDYHPEFFEDIRIGIFGKGGRMFDWLKAVNDPAAMSYYKACFGEGYGFKVKDDIRQFSMKSPDHQYVKSEVSFGLSRRDQLESTGNKISELIGEEGYSYNGSPVESSDDVSLDYLKNFGTEFSYPREFKRFSDFLAIFYSFSKDQFGFSMPGIRQDAQNMPLVSYVNNIPEYILARDAQDFDFEAPVIILEGMCFLDEVLLKKLFNG